MCGAVRCDGDEWLDEWLDVPVVRVKHPQHERQVGCDALVASHSIRYCRPVGQTGGGGVSTERMPGAGAVSGCALRWLKRCACACVAFARVVERTRAWTVCASVFTGHRTAPSALLTPWSFVFQLFTAFSGNFTPPVHSTHQTHVSIINKSRASSQGDTLVGGPPPRTPFRICINSGSQVVANRIFCKTN